MDGIDCAVYISIDQFCMCTSSNPMAAAFFRFKFQSNIISVIWNTRNKTNENQLFTFNCYTQFQARTAQNYTKSILLPMIQQHQLYHSALWHAFIDTIPTHTNWDTLPRCPVPFPMLYKNSCTCVQLNCNWWRKYDSVWKSVCV